MSFTRSLAAEGKGLRRMVSSRPSAVWAMSLLTCEFLTSAVIAAENFTVNDTIPLPAARPSSMVLKPDGSQLYVLDFGEEAPNNVGNVIVIDTATNNVVDNIPLLIGFPFQIDITPDGGTCYVAMSKATGGTVSSGFNHVAVIDTATSRQDQIPIPGGDYGPIGIAVSPDGSSVYVTHRGDNRVDIINTASNTVVNSVSSGVGPVGLAFTPDGSRVYVANRSTSTVSVIETRTKTIVATVPLSIGPSNSHTFVAITHDGSRAYVTYANSDAIAIVDTNPDSRNYHTQLATIATSGGSLRRIRVSSDGTRAFVAAPGTDEALVIDIDPASQCFNTEVGGVAVGDGPSDIALLGSPVDVGYVSNAADETVSVVGPCVSQEGRSAPSFAPAMHDVGAPDQTINLILSMEANEVADACCRWDCINGDGEVGIEEFLAVLGTWGQICAPCDFNGNGVGIDDFLRVLGFWGPCP